MTDYLTRDQISEKLQDEGFDVSVRTIRFWESEGMLPRADLIEGQASHRVGSLSTARVLAVTRPKALAKFRRNGNESVTIIKMTEDELVLKISYSKEKNNG